MSWRLGTEVCVASAPQPRTPLAYGAFGFSVCRLLCSLLQGSELASKSEPGASPLAQPASMSSGLWDRQLPAMGQ